MKDVAGQNILVNDTIAFIASNQDPTTLLSGPRLCLATVCSVLSDRICVIKHRVNSRERVTVYLPERRVSTRVIVLIGHRKGSILDSHAKYAFTPKKAKKTCIKKN